VDPATPERRTGKLPRTVIVVGLVSLFNDFASEMVVPLIPLLLATVLAGGPVALGLIEGMADAGDARISTDDGASPMSCSAICCRTWCVR